MSECNHIKTASQAYFFPWIAAEDDMEMKYYDHDEAANCPNCNPTKESHDTQDSKNDSV